MHHLIEIVCEELEAQSQASATALADYLTELSANGGFLDTPDGAKDECEELAGWADQTRRRLLELEGTPERATLPGLMRLFPSLAEYADRAENTAWNSTELLAHMKRIQSGSGATYAALFIAGAFDAHTRAFNLSRAFSAWDSDHRKAWAKACQLIAAR